MQGNVGKLELIKLKPDKEYIPSWSDLFILIQNRVCKIHCLSINIIILSKQ